MDLPNLENYPVYILVPDLAEEGNIQIPQQITSSEPLSYNFYIPNVEHSVPIVNEESVQPIVSRKKKRKPTKRLSYEKIVHNTVNDVHIVESYRSNFSNINNLSLLKDKKISNDDNEVLKCNTKIDANSFVQSNGKEFSNKAIGKLSSLLEDEDIQNDNNEVHKYDQKTDSNVIFHLVRPADLEINPIEIKAPKRGRPRKIESEKTLNEINQPESTKLLKPEDIIEYPLTSTKSGRLCRPPNHLLNRGKLETKKKYFPIIDNDDILGRKKVKYNVNSDFVCGGCGKTYLGHKRMQEHLEKFPTHKINTTEQQVDSELQNIFKNLHETPTNIDINNDKKETHTQTEVLKDRHCGYMKSKKNLGLHLKHVMKHLQKSNIIKSLSGTISVWDLLYDTLENGNLQLFSKELNTLIVNLKNLSKSLKLVSKCESYPIENNQMFISDSLEHLFGLPRGCYDLQNIQNEYEIEQTSDVWTMDSKKTVEPKVSTPQNLDHHSSSIHLNLFDSQSSKVDFLLSSSMEESIMCDENQAALESVDGLVSERLRSMSDHLHSSVPIIDYPITTSTSSVSNITQPNSYIGHGVYEDFTNDLNLVPTSTEEFIKSLEQFEPLNDTDNTLNTETRMLDFEDLQHTFHTT